MTGPNIAGETAALSKLRLCIAGKNRIAVEAAGHVRQHLPEVDLCVAVNQTDDGEDGWQPSLLHWARRTQTPIVELADLYAHPHLVFVSLEFDRLLKPALFASSRLYNVHFSLLPEYKGSLTSIWPILDGKEYSGVTLHRIDAGIDTGAIIAQEKFPIPLAFNSRMLYERYIETGLKLVQQWLPGLLTEDPPAVPQSAVGATFRSRRSLDFAKLSIDLRRTAFEVHNQVRAYCFREYQLPTVHGATIAGSEMLAQRSTARPGMLVHDDDLSLVFATVDYDVRLWKDVLPEFLQCCERGDLDLATRFARSVPNVNARNQRGWSPLIVASFHGHMPIVKVLLEAGADVNQTNYKGTTVLMYGKSPAERTGDRQVMEVLLAAGAALNARDREGRTILGYARAQGAEQIADWLVARGALE